jgi:hypothetical protein
MTKQFCFYHLTHSNFQFFRVDFFLFHQIVVFICFVFHFVFTIGEVLLSKTTTKIIQRYFPDFLEEKYLLFKKKNKENFIVFWLPK